MNTTPGSWIAIDTTTNDNCPVWHAEVRTSAGASTYRVVALMRSLEFQRGDAHLIAAAPDLRDALLPLSYQREGRCWCDVAIGNPMARLHSAACDQAREAFVKAGEDRGIERGGQC